VAASLEADTMEDTESAAEDSESDTQPLMLGIAMLPVPFVRGGLGLAYRISEVVKMRGQILRF